MYKIISVTDRDGNLKEDFMKNMEEAHPTMSGRIYGWPMLLKPGGYLGLVWNDASGKMLQTSYITDDVIREGRKLIITTLNSIYTLEKMEVKE